MASKVAQLSAIHTEIFFCEKCPLHQGRTRTVPGAGNPNAEILFIGEAPGENEDLQGLPFVGRSGNYLDELLASIHLSRDDVFIANVVKCRPPDNRDPNPHEIEACNPYLTEQIRVIDPLVIATLGRFSMAMFFPNERISHIHGQIKWGVQRAYLPLYHPAAVLRNANLRPEMQADFDQIPALLEMVKARRAAGWDTAETSVAETQVEEVLPPPPPIDDEPTDKPDQPRQMGLFDE